MAHNPYDITGSYDPFLARFPSTQFFFVQWLDFLGQMRMRCVPTATFRRLLETGQRLGISHGNLGTLQNDGATPVCDPVGAIFVEPDLQTLRPMQTLGTQQNAATVMARFTDSDGLPLQMCPRSTLQNLIQTFQREYNVNFLVGFEIEVTFCKRNPSADGDLFTPLDSTRSWGTFTDEQYVTAFPLMTKIILALQSIGIGVDYLHAESGPGQYEFVLPPYPPVLAVDILIQARQCIMQVAATHGLRATCYPTSFAGIGNAAHAHMSFNSTKLPPEELEKLEIPFMASLLDHMSSLCALTMPQGASYSRVVDNSWSGGTWIAWGTQNREVPLRKPAKLRWEVRCLDGCANMYLAMSAILGIGLHGIRTGTKMSMKDCPKNPTALSSEELNALGITKKLPKSIDEAVESADKDSELEQGLPSGMLKHYLIMKKTEQAMLNDMSETDRKVWLMERY